MQNLLNELKILLADLPRFTYEGRLVKQAVIDAAQSLDIELLQLLMSHDAIKKHFFQNVGGVMVFDKVKLLRFVSNKAFLEDSYTSFKNKIGLVTKNSDGTYDAYLSDAKEVVLAYPYKDCMLEGGQTKEEQKRSEIFWNETLAPDDIDRLKEPKAFTNIKRYRQDNAFSKPEPEPLSINDNYIIKGNNLLALYSLLPVYRGKVKLIYIDPPYNTESDSFNYNDSFNRSAWLTFMKDRIRAAKDLLAKEGFLFVHISFHQYAYLKVLLDEEFNQNNICTFNLLVRHPNRILKADKDFHDVMEYILVYTKNKVANKIAKIQVENTIDNYVYKIKELSEGKKIKLNGGEATYFEPAEYEIIKEVPNVENLQKISIRGSLKEGNSSGRFYEKYLAPIKNQFSPMTIFKVNDMGNDSFDHRYFYVPEVGKANGGYFQGVPKDSKEFKIKPYPNFLDFVQEFNNVGYEGTVEFRNGKKPESLLKKVFEIGGLEKGDLVLDFFLGSGTTAATAHKLGLKYIGIEQLNYERNGSVARINAVVQGEQNGISDDENVNWQGGGSFVYMELAQANEHFKEQLQAANTEGVLLEIWERMKTEAFISHRIDLSRESDYFGKEYEALNFEDKKRFLIETLDKNMLYVPYCDMESKEFGLSEADKAATKAFYNLKNEA